MTGQHSRYCHVELRGQPMYDIAHHLGQCAVEFFQILAAKFLAGQETLAHRIWHAGHLHRTASGLDTKHLIAPADDHIRHSQRAKDVQTGGLFFHSWQIVVAHKQHSGHTSIGEAFDTASKFTLIGGIGIARLEGITCENYQVNLVRQAILDHLVQAM